MLELPVIHTRYTDAVLSAVLSGFFLHYLFNKFETQNISLLKYLLFTLPLLPSYILWPHCGSIFSATLVGYSTCFTTLIFSVITYRLSPIHPLAKYPGPLLAKCTKFWSVYHSATGKTHRNFLNIHKEYGSIVRTGPNELSLCDVEYIQPILGNDGLAKGPIWDGRRSPKGRYFSLIGIRNTSMHLQRRKLWNKAFSTSRVKEYEPLLRKRLDQLVDVLRSKAQERQVVDMAEWMSYFSIDFMGDMAFGGGFELMRDGDIEGICKLIEGGVRIQSYTQHVPWASPILYGIPGIGKTAEKLLNFVIKISMDRINRGMSPSGEDLSSHLLDEVSPSPKPLVFGEYSSDAFLVIIAGSDTTATVLSSIFFHILSDKSLFERLRKEIDDNFPLNEGKVPADDSSKLANMVFLNAVIKEALRLQPPVPTGIQRTPDPGSGGRMVGSLYIPEGTGVYIPPYAIQRDERYFYPHPNTFWPDRWLSSASDVKTTQAAFLPYSVGPLNCVGKLLAQLELRIVVATLVQKFDMKLSEAQEGNWENELEDYFVFKKGMLPVAIGNRM